MPFMNPNMILKVSTACLAAIFILAACEQQPAEQAAGKGKAVEYSLTDLDGKVHSLSDYRGKWVVVNHWATWCPPCLEELPELDQFHLRHKDKDAVVWGVNEEDISPEELRKFLQGNPVGYPVFQVPADSGSPLGAVPAIPTTFLISPEGEVIARRLGGLKAKELEEFIARHHGG